jgi:hypothetical protein
VKIYGAVCSVSDCTIGRRQEEEADEEEDTF